MNSHTEYSSACAGRWYCSPFFAESHRREIGKHHTACILYARRFIPQLHSNGHHNNPTLGRPGDDCRTSTCHTAHVQCCFTTDIHSFMTAMRRDGMASETAAQLRLVVGVHIHMHAHGCGHTHAHGLRKPGAGLQTTWIDGPQGFT